MRKTNPIGHRFKLLSYMASKEIKIREPNTLIEAGQKLTREELIIWLWSMLKARITGIQRTLTKEDIEDLKKRREVPILTGEVDIKELRDLFPEYFSERKLKYYKTLLKSMEDKIAFEVNLPNYIDTLKKLGFEYVLQKLEIPSPEDSEYYGIAVIMAVNLSKKGIIKITFSPYVSPFLLELKTRYTTYDFLQILELSSKYSIVLYRLIKEHIGLKHNTFQVTLDKLQKLMDTSFKRWVDFNRKVLKPAVEELNLKTKYSVEYTTIKQGKKVTAIKFSIKEKKYLPFLGKLDLKPLLEELVSSFQKGGENITVEEFAEVLLSLERVNPAIALWFLLHYPEGEAQLYAWEHIKITEQNFKINHPDKFLESLIKDKNPELDWLLDQRTKDLIRKELEKIAKPLLEKRKEQEREQEIKDLVEEIILIAKTLSDKYKQKLKEILGIANFREHLLELAQQKDLAKLQEIYQLVTQLSEENWKEKFGEF